RGTNGRYCGRAAGLAEACLVPFEQFERIAHGCRRWSVGWLTNRGWCNGSTRSFGVLSRGSNPRPRALGKGDAGGADRREAKTESTHESEARMRQYRPLSAVVLAAGEGTRMRSGTPKVLHQLCGRPMVLHVVDALAELPLERIVVVVGHAAER